jgi:hypothetical protein
MFRFLRYYHTYSRASHFILRPGSIQDANLPWTSFCPLALSLFGSSLRECVYSFSLGKCNFLLRTVQMSLSQQISVGLGSLSQQICRIVGYVMDGSALQASTNYLLALLPSRLDGICMVLCDQDPAGRYVNILNYFRRNWH